jgi:UDP-glucose:(heptosyl)LPS alpha-1,3-glucosyltransferase
VQTERDKQNLRKRGVNENRIITFPFNGIDRNIFKIKRNSIRDIDMLFIGRMDKEHSYKGYWILLDIIREIKKIKGDRVSITVVGGGSDFSYFFKKSIEEKLNLNFLTDISDEDLVLILNRAKTIILPSTSNSEGFGRVVLEAIFCGVVPIVSKYAGSSEVINEYNSGIVIDPFNIKDTQFAIIDLLDNDQKLHEFKMNMIKMLENGTFTVDWTISKTLEIYSQIVKEKKSYNNLP